MRRLLTLLLFSAILTFLFLSTIGCAKTNCHSDIADDGNKVTFYSDDNMCGQFYKTDDGEWKVVVYPMGTMKVNYYQTKEQAIHQLLRWCKPIPYLKK